MKVLHSWLREFAPVGDDIDRISNELSDLGLAVESVERRGEGLGGIVVAEVLALRPHPKADRIQLVDVDAGDGEALQICCGAFNMAAGDLVPLATLGTTMPGGMTIERRKLRGEWSNGMLCSATEMGMGADASGIMVLDSASLAAGATPGTPLVEALGLQPDVLWDLEVNPNRPDAMSVAGVARDLAARLGVPFAIAEPKVTEAGPVLDGACSVEIVDADLCGRFLVRVLRNVTLGPTPPEMADRLRALGMRPISPIVDLSNYVMLELGQPNHTYDLATVPDGQLRVRWARAGETLVTLDSVERTLLASDGVIANRDDVAIGLAGVMGGASTEISDTTNDVLLEMAWWDPMSVARTSRRLGLRSEASMRFERGADHQILELAAARFCELAQQRAASVVEVAPGTVVQEGQLPQRPPVRLRTARLQTYLGAPIERDESRDLLEAIGFSCADADDDLDVQIPSFRYDSASETDVIEEVARTYSYGRLPRTLPHPEVRGGLTPYQQGRRLLREVLLGLGCTEVLPMPFLAPGELEAAGVPQDGVVIANPLDANESVLRTALRPGLLKTLAYNASHRRAEAVVFEIGTVFLRDGGEAPLPAEPERLAVVMAGSEAPDLVQLWRAVGDALGVPIGLRNEASAGLHPGRSAAALVEGQPVGVLGEIDPAVAERFDVHERVAYLEVDVVPLLAARVDRAYAPVSRFPSSDIDLAFTLADDVPADTLDGTVREAAGELLVGLELFDVYRGTGVPEGSRSLAYTLRLQATDRTLTDAEVAEVRTRVVEVTAASGATLRG